MPMLLFPKCQLWSSQNLFQLIHDFLPPHMTSMTNNADLEGADDIADESDGFHIEAGGDEGGGYGEDGIAGTDGVNACGRKSW